MAKHIQQSVNAITRRALERYGFAYADILTHWRAIVGSELADYCVPVRIQWPRANVPEAAHSRRRLGGTLVVKAADGRAVEVQHDTIRIIDRVNSFYGYQAVCSMKIVQGVLPKTGKAAPRSEPLPPEKEKRLAEAIAPVEDDALRAALDRLGHGALAPATRKADI